MEIRIRKPLGYSQIGRKDRQEDAVWPLFSDVTADNRCIVLCDGVGGSEHGEVASQVSSKVIGEYLTGVLSKANFVSEEDVQDAVNLAYDELERIDKEASEAGSVSMATTLTCICLHNNGILVAHMGDSRIYHIRPRQGLLYESSDHSLVNALLQAGELTIEEAKVFPRKNVITKAIQPHGNKRFKAEVHQLTDIKAGDYIFLCCDGVLEQLTNERLVEILAMSCSEAEKIHLLEEESTGRTRDNYTAYLIPIESVEGETSLELEDGITADVEVENEDEKKSIEPEICLPPRNIDEPLPPKTRDAKKKLSLLEILLGILIVLLLSSLLVQFFWQPKSEEITVKVKKHDGDSLNKAKKNDSLIKVIKKKPEE